MDTFKRLLCLCAIFVLSTPSFVVSGCSNETPCQPGFLCSPHKKCIPASGVITLFPNQLKDPQIISGTASLRVLRETKALEEDGAASILKGNEGNNDREEENLAPKGEHKQHKHHSKSHKHGKNKAHHNSGGTSKKDGLKMLQNITGFSDTRQLKSLIFDDNKEFGEFPIARDKRLTPDVSQWQDILNTLKQGDIGATTALSNADDMESDTGRQLEMLEAIEHQLEEEIAKSESAAKHGHHRQHPSMDIEAKKEEIQVLKEIEDSLQQTPPTEDNHAVTTGAHTHGSTHSHHHKHGHMQEAAAEGKPLNDPNNHPHHGHSHSKPSTDAEATLSPDDMEKVVFDDILKAESDGLTRKQGIELEREIESLEEIEKQTTEDLIKNSDSQTNLDEAENRLQLWGVLQQLDQKLKTQFPNTKLSRERRSVGANAHTETKRSIGMIRGRVLAELRKATQAARRLKQAQSNNAPASNSATAPTNQQAKTKVPAKTKDDIGVINSDRCKRCEPLIGEEVCGANGKTYVSLCHAVNCAGLRESDITASRCVEEDECVSNRCSEREQCVPMTHGTCLALYSKDGYTRLPCRRYICASKDECVTRDDEHGEVCGENGKTYLSLCYLHKAGVPLAYTGLCRFHLCRGQVCGNDGITYESSCHARAHGVRIDYTGECFTEDQNGRLTNCAAVREAERCAKLQCSDPVLPAGACCPLCGGALLVHPDSGALAELVQSWEEVNHLYMVENFLRHLLSNEEAAKCELTATLTNSGNFSVVLSAATATDHTICLNAGKNLAQAINKKSPMTEDAMLGPVAKTAKFINPFNPEASIKGFLLDSQNKMMSKASDLKDQAAGKANDALVEAEKHVKEQQNNNMANKALGKSVTVLMCIWTYICAIACAIAMTVA